MSKCKSCEGPLEYDRTKENQCCCCTAEDVERFALFEEMTQAKTRVFSIDFDGTLVDHVFPGIGAPLPGGFELLKELQAKGHKLILWTCREDVGYRIDRRHLTEAVQFCEEQGVVFDSVNEALPDWDFREKGLRRKPYAHYYIDDAIIGGFPGWDKIREFLVTEGIL